MTASVGGDRYFSNDVNHSMGPALIGEEIYDSVGTCSITLSFIGDDVLSFRNGYTLSSLCTRNTQHCHPTLKIGGDKFRIIYVGGVFVFSQSGRIISTETDERSQTTAE